AGEGGEELGRGGVGTGADAIANGLADEAGGLREAIAIARKRAGLPADAPVRIYPRLGPLDQLRPAESSEAKPAARAQLGAGALGALVADRWGPAWRVSAAARPPPPRP